jgi:hypothetical protein
MKKLCLIFLLLLSGCGRHPFTSPIVVPGTDAPAVITAPETPALDKTDYEYYLRAICRVYCGNSGGSGTCFKIDDQYVYVITCHHVVDNKQTAAVEFWFDGKITGKYSAKVYKTYNVDAAVLRVPRSSFNGKELPVAIPISQSPPKLNDTIVSAGCPNLWWPLLWEGKIIGFTARQDQSGSKSFKFVPPAHGGQSGSGIFRNGEIVGILWGSDGKIGYAVGCQDFQEIANMFVMIDGCTSCKQMESIIIDLRKHGLDIQIINGKFNFNLIIAYGIKEYPTYINKRNEKMIGAKTAKELQEFYSRKPEIKYHKRSK